MFAVLGPTERKATAKVSLSDVSVSQAAWPCLMLDLHLQPVLSVGIAEITQCLPLNNVK